MKKKIIVLMFVLLVLVCFGLIVFYKKEKLEEPEKSIEHKNSVYYEKVDNNEGYIIYNENGEEIDVVGDESLLDSQMHIYEIDPDYDSTFP